MPTVIANELVGVQPMTGPVGQIHTLESTLCNAMTDNSAAATQLQQVKKHYHHSRLQLHIQVTTLQQRNWLRWKCTAAMEGVGRNKISVQILKQAVEAKTRKLQARWTFEAAQDAQAMHGIDVEAEIMAALAQEITAEIDQEILLSLRTLAATEFTYNQAAVSGTATFVGDEHAALAVLINRTANLIAQRTRRGAGNYAVVSPASLTVLQSATTSAFARTTEGTFEAPTNTKFVGTLNGTMRVFCDSYASDASSISRIQRCIRN